MSNAEPFGVEPHILAGEHIFVKRAIHVTLARIVFVPAGEQVEATVTISRSGGPQHVVLAVEIEKSDMSGGHRVAIKPHTCEIGEVIAVETVKAARAAQPYQSVIVLHHRLDGIALQSVNGREVSRSRHDRRGGGVCA